MEFAGVSAISAASTTTDGGVLGFKACFCSKFNNLSLRAKCDCRYMHAADWIYYIASICCSAERVTLKVQMYSDSDGRLQSKLSTCLNFASTCIADAPAR